ncbi:MAG: MBL fold metallo-hydrolase, partial [Desulfosudaceae bacterium]
MHIDILATESLGVRGLCCAVRTRQGRFLIDPGLALGFIREGLPPHPIQVAAGETAARRIVRHLAAATDVIFSHFHGDHVPLAEANPYQLPLAEVAPLLRRPRLWAKDTRGEPAGFA